MLRSTLKESPKIDLPMTRREFLKTTAFLGGSALLLRRIDRAFELLHQAEAGEGSALYELSRPENILRTVCLQCNTGCGIKVKLLQGVVVKIDGNPQSPWTMTPHLPYTASPFDTARIDGAICPKGQAGIQTLYDPYRLRAVLKRAGPRGSNRWRTISFEQAIEEIVNGGYLFKDVPGEENRYVQGLKEIWALRDPKLAAALAADVEKIKKKEMTVAEFKAKHREHLHLLIDPDHPDLGPKNNQFVFMWGRLKGGRGDLIKRFTGDALGSVNAHGHTTVCQGSLYFTCKAMSEQYIGGKWTGGRKFYWQADTANARFIIFVGASPFEGNYGPPLRSSKITDGIVHGRLKIAVVDPRLSKTAAKAWKWVPIKPGTEAALALGMIRWIIENKRYDARYLQNANKGAAKADGEPTWTNATWLIKIGPDGRPGRFLRAKEIGLSEKDEFVVLRDGKPVAFDPYDEKTPVEGDLLVDTVIGGIRVKSGLQVLYESSKTRTLAAWAKLCGIKEQDIVELAWEFTSYGKQAAVDIHRGVSQHTNGFYNVLAWMSLNLLVGNFDWKGGMIKATTYDIVGGRPPKPFDLSAMAGKMKPFGISIIRHEVKYEESTLFSGYPAKRPWYPLASDIYQEIIPSAGDGYPYPIKALFLYMGSPVYSLPAGHTNIEILRDPAKIPLVVACDITVGETSMYADYIFPDLTYLERWEFMGSHPSVAQKVQPIFSPVVAPIPRTVRVFGEEIPLSLEALILGIAEKMGLPGFGKDAFGPGLDFRRPEDLYLRMVANVAAGDAPGEEVPDADAAEVDLFLRARSHLPKSVFDPNRWRRIVGDRWWPKVIYVLNRGGRFENYEQGYEGEKVRHKYGTLINLYSEKAAETKNSMAGKPFLGIATYVPITDSLGRPIPDEAAGYTLNLITHREIFHTKSRTIADYWLLSIYPENFVVMNKRDAEKLGLSEGDLVRITSASNPEGVWPVGNGKQVPMVGKVKVVEGMRPGVISFSLGNGHWAYGSTDIVVDGKVIKGDPRRRTGVHANAAMRIDPYLKNTCLVDLTGGSAVFYDTRVKLVKVR
ncbi:MAG: molybdopterin-dependent oxidoreductase [Armatimonadota bacterium]|nr:molybdopterin-dependent oxidoreductase [Armatimonadota bacterium]MDR5702091.1 molybdopterin-dependent oxidoreductase [Armatimonadota bacterium]